MRLTVQPDALQIAGDDLARCADQLDLAVAEFCGAADRCVPGAGRAAYGAIGTTARSAAHAGHVVVSDLHQLATALRELAAGYAELDRRLVPGPPRR